MWIVEIAVNGTLIFISMIGTKFSIISSIFRASVAGVGVSVGVAFNPVAVAVNAVFEASFILDYPCCHLLGQSTVGRHGFSLLFGTRSSYAMHSIWLCVANIQQRYTTMYCSIHGSK